jgi:hypothetical protein
MQGGDEDQGSFGGEARGAETGDHQGNKGQTSYYTDGRAGPMYFSLVLVLIMFNMQ